jgi:hypothetical protein
MKKCLIYIVILSSVIITACRKGDYELPDDSTFVTDDGKGTGSVTWTNDKIWILDGKIFVNDGQTLTIEPGTIIKAKEGDGEYASALIVARGGKIIAEGTADNPIIFTSVKDKLDGTHTLNDKGLWGGIIILGEGEVNVDTGEGRVEGIPLSEPRSIYGGTNNSDNSGILKYVSIRHGGANIGEGNEINGLTLAGVGSETTIDYIEVVANADDAFEFFGGTVNCKHLIAAYCGDDSFDFDQGYQGFGQYFLSINDQPDGGDKIIELDNHPEKGSLTSNSTKPIIANLTAIGNKTVANFSIFINSGSAIQLYNSIIINSGAGVNIDYKGNSYDSYSQWTDKNTTLEYNIFYNAPTNESDKIFIAHGEPISNTLKNNWAYYFRQGYNTTDNPGITITGSSYNIIPANNTGILKPINNKWFTSSSNKGAFDTNWADKWTFISQKGIIE